MNITTELRNHAHKRTWDGAETYDQHLDRSDEMAELGWVRLPEDAEGVPFRVGDHVEVPDGLPSEGKPWQAGTITRLDLGATCWHVRVIAGGMNHVYLTENVRHYHAPTVEDVLTEFAEKITDSQIPNVHPTYEEAIAEYATKLRLAGEDA